MANITDPLAVTVEHLEDVLPTELFVPRTPAEIRNRVTLSGLRYARISQLW
jgi:hypothetical protein